MASSATRHDGVAAAKTYSLCGTLDEATVRKGDRFFSATSRRPSRFTTVDKERSTERKQYTKADPDNTILADGVADIFALAGLDNETLARCRMSSLKTCARWKAAAWPWSLEKLLRDEIKARHANNGSRKKYGDRLLETCASITTVPSRRHRSSKLIRWPRNSRRCWSARRHWFGAG